MAKKIIPVGIILIGSALVGIGYILTFNAFLDDVLE